LAVLKKLEAAVGTTNWSHGNCARILFAATLGHEIQTYT
jgi:hypothetical protein